MDPVQPEQPPQAEEYVVLNDGTRFYLWRIGIKSEWQYDHPDDSLVQ